MTEGEITASVIGLQKEMTAGLFTLFGVLITLFIGWINMRRQNRYDSLKGCAEKLTSERLKMYPALYNIVSTAIKQIEFPKACNRSLDLQDLLGNVNEWDSENGIFLTKFSGDRTYALRLLLRDLIDRKIIDNDYIMLKKALTEMEIGLRVDLSIYALEYGTIRRAFRGQSIG